ncbi:MAG: M14 family zinc carboxypeptidase [Planctomycetota bacterium]
MVRSCVTRVRLGGALLSVSIFAGVATAAPTVGRQVIGRSPGGSPIEVWTVSDRSASDRGTGERPAIAILAGIQGHHQIGARVAESIKRRLIEDHADSIADRTVYIIPAVNPEGLARFASPGVPKALSGRVPDARDSDRDRRVDEDPPNDLDGDGVITMMRIPAPKTAFGIEPTHVVDQGDPRIVREPEDDEVPTHAVLIEGVDDDGDGRFNEDGWGGASGGGVDLDMHFPTHWPEHADGAGRFPLDRPEALAVAEWLQARRNIVAVIVYGPHDTIVSTPPKGKYGPEGRVPKGIEEDDAAVYTLAAEAFKDATGITKTEPGPDRAGSLLQWCYADLGVYAFGTPVWVRPDLVKQDGASVDEAALDANADDAGPAQEDIEAADRADLTERGGGEDPGLSQKVDASIGATGADGAQKPKPSGDSAESKWLRWIDERGGDGFVEWQPFEHPQLGSVEIGGFVPGVRVNPPAGREAELVEQQAVFAAAVLDMLPRVEIDDPTVERVGARLWRVGVTLRNSGTLPTKSSIGVKTRRLPGIVCVMDPDRDLETDRIVSGSRAIRFASIDGRGSSERAEWLVIADASDTVDLEIRTPMFGTTRYELTMETER